MKFLFFVKSVLKDIYHLLKGLIEYGQKGIHSKDAHFAMIRLFCLSGGWTNSFCSKIISWKRRKPYVFDEIKGALGTVTPEDVQKILMKLKKEGFIIFKERLPEKDVEEILKFSLSQESKILYPDLKPNQPSYGRYDRACYQGICYDILPEKAMMHSKIQSLLFDMSFLAIAQAYLGCKPIVEPINLRWSTSLMSKPNDEAAQSFHFDMDRFRWIKFFMYLTDVGEENGPHVFVRGSHRNQGIPKAIRRQGYARISDTELRQYYSKEDIVPILAPKGTIFAVDTRGLHKGMALKSGDRLMLQLQFSNALFGCETKNLSMQTAFHDCFIPLLTKYRESYGNLV